MKKAASALFAILFIISCVPFMAAFGETEKIVDPRPAWTQEQKDEWTKTIEDRVAQGLPLNIQEPDDSVDAEKRGEIIPCDRCSNGNIRLVSQTSSSVYTGETKPCSKNWKKVDLRVETITLYAYQCGSCGYGFHVTGTTYTWECGHS